MSAYHRVQGERGGERESTQSKRTEGQKGEKERGGERRGRIFPIRWSNEKEARKGTD